MKGLSLLLFSVKYLKHYLVTQSDFKYKFFDKISSSFTMCVQVFCTIYHLILCIKLTSLKAINCFLWYWWLAFQFYYYLLYLLRLMQLRPANCYKFLLEDFQSGWFYLLKKDGACCWPLRYLHIECRYPFKLHIR